jgi:hypothetical protein
MNEAGIIVPVVNFTGDTYHGLPKLKGNDCGIFTVRQSPGNDRSRAEPGPTPGSYITQVSEFKISK